MGVALLAACGVANAGDYAKWNEIATTVDGTDRYDVKVGSLITTRSVALITARDVDLHTHEITFRVMGLGLKSCIKQMGQLHIFDLSGNRILSQEFVLGGDTVAAQIAETICDLAQSRGAHTRAPAADL